jgi:hypothetical protein
MEDRQNMEGGWGHGVSLGQEYYPSTLVAASAWALLALGGCGRHGVDIDEDAIDDALDLLRSVQAPSGGFPYGGPEYLKSIEAGRTSGVVLALAALGRADSELFGSAVQYMRRNVASIPDGHASPAMHVLFGALAARVAGDDAWEDYSRSVLERVAAAQQADGSFTDIVELSPDSFEFMGGKLVNRAYITALYAAALAAPRSRFVERIGLKDGALAERSDPPSPEAAVGGPSSRLQRLWSRSLRGAQRVALCAGHCGVLDGEGDIVWLAAADGREVLRESLAIGPVSAESTGLMRFESHLVFWSQREDENLPRSIAEVLEKGGSSERPGSIGCSSPESGSSFWIESLPGALSAIHVAGDGVYALTRNGTLTVRAYSDGAVVRTYPRQKVWINAAVAACGGGGVIVCSESRITALDSSGEILWKGRLRGNRGVTPPSFAALCTWEDRLYTGATDGSVCRRDIATGRLQWEASLPCAVYRMVASRAGELFVLTWDRRVQAVADGRILWTHDLGEGRESVHRPEIRHDGHYLWVFSPARHRLAALDPATGLVKAALDLPADSSWHAASGKAVVAGRDRVECFEVSGGD